jgi:hypothetical protein
MSKYISAKAHGTIMVVVAVDKMIKTVFILLSTFWLSCGSKSHIEPNKTGISEKQPETTQIDTLESNFSEIQEDSVFSEVKEAVIPIKENSEPVTEKEVSLPDHSQWNDLLIKHVNDKGDVDYKGFQNDASPLDDYLNHLAENRPEKNWAKNEKLAYYINLYNAATVKLILDNYPTKSIKDIKNPWGRNWVKMGDGLLSLGDIEHKILRKMNEPRIHFAINCASFSCPKLLNRAFTTAQLETQLHEATFDFVNDKTRNEITKEKMYLSNIFKWYKKDFTENGTLSDYIKPYTQIEINDNTDIGFLKYDWNLNEAK